MQLIWERHYLTRALSSQPSTMQVSTVYNYVNMHVWLCVDNCAGLNKVKIYSDVYTQYFHLIINFSFFF